MQVNFNLGWKGGLVGLFILAALVGYLFGFHIISPEDIKTWISQALELAKSNK